MPRPLCSLLAALPSPAVPGWSRDGVTGRVQDARVHRGPGACPPRRRGDTVLLHQAPRAKDTARALGAPGPEPPPSLEGPWRGRAAEDGHRPLPGGRRPPAWSRPTERLCSARRLPLRVCRRLWIRLLRPRPRRTPGPRAQRLATALPSRRLRPAPPCDPVGQRPESPAVRAPVFSASSCGTGSLHLASAPRPPRGGRVCDRETQAVQRRQGTRPSQADAAARRASAAQRGPARGRHRVDPRTAAALPALRLG